MGGGDCGIRFEEQETYIVFGYVASSESSATPEAGPATANEDVGHKKIWTGYCSGTVKLRVEGHSGLFEASGILVEELDRLKAIHEKEEAARTLIEKD